MPSTSLLDAIHSLADLTDTISHLRDVRDIFREQGASGTKLGEHLVGLVHDKEQLEARCITQLAALRPLGLVVEDRVYFAGSSGGVQSAPRCPSPSPEEIQKFFETQV